MHNYVDARIEARGLELVRTLSAEEGTRRDAAESPTSDATAATAAISKLNYAETGMTFRLDFHSDPSTTSSFKIYLMQYC